MSSIIKRMRTMRAKLFSIRCGPGAIILPKEVKGLIVNMDGTTSGLRAFRAGMLRRIKYHNEELDVQLREGGSHLVVQYGGKKPNFKIGCHNVKSPALVLERLVKATNAKEIPMTAADRALAEDSAKVFKRIVDTRKRNHRARVLRNRAFKKKHGISIRNIGKRKAKMEADAKKKKTL